MINWLIDLSLRNRVLVIAVFLLLGGLGVLGAADHARSTRSPTSRTTR